MITNSSQSNIFRTPLRLVMKRSLFGIINRWKIFLTPRSHIYSSFFSKSESHFREDTQLMSMPSAVVDKCLVLYKYMLLHLVNIFRTPRPHSYTTLFLHPEWNSDVKESLFLVFFVNQSLLSSSRSPKVVVDSWRRLSIGF